jgi:DnaK suppressor protein
MDSKQRTILKQKIEDSILQTIQEISELKELTKPIFPDVAIGRISRMDAINNKTVNEAALKKAQDKLKKLNHALSKIDDSNFGNCASCGSEIQEGRLLLMPESNKCVRCAARF